MSIQLIKHYQGELAKVKDLGAMNEMALKRPFANLLQAYCQKKNLTLVEEISIKNDDGKIIRPDGIVKGSTRLDWGYWESKDEADDIEEEVKKKFAKGYPNDNIIFEDTQNAILYQNGQRVAVANMQGDGKELDILLTQFIAFERPEYAAFREAIESFKDDVPAITKALRKLMDEQAKENKEFVAARNNFLQICQDSINPEITKENIREMIVQHILTEDIFTTIFDEADFHHSNNIAAELESVIKTFFVKDVKRNFFSKVRNYYKAIQAVASKIEDTREKQNFLKVIYEDFYKAYNPKGADKLGIVYTPNEIVRFMIESTDHLLYEHFGKELLSKNVEILDPATGTGTFITDLIDYFPSSKKEQIKYKYEHELHANEVSILPYYIANLNIEFAYQQKIGEYKSFENLVFVDTLDNMGFGYKGKQGSLLTSISAENLDRIKKQNAKKISVIIGNPPYNAMQSNFNENNANRKYPEVDKRIKETFIKEGSAQLQNQLYDMYVRFYRWAMDRIDQNGVVAFVTNRSFIDSRTFDGFRKCVQNNFNHIYIVDTQSDVRVNPKIAGTTHNIFGIQTGVAIMFLVKNEKLKNKSRIDYFTLKDEMRKEDKLNWLRSSKFHSIPFELITPDSKYNWLNILDNDFEKLLPLIDKSVKIGQKEEAVFKLYSRGITTSRDEWVYDFDKKDLQNKVKFFIDFFIQEKERWKQSDKKTKTIDFVNRAIKWTSELEAHLENFGALEEELTYLQALPPNGKRVKIRKLKEKLKRYAEFKFSRKNIIPSLYRPFVKNYNYFDRIITHRIYQNDKIFGFQNELENKVIYFSGLSSSKPFQSLATNQLAGLDFLEKTQCLPLFRYNSEGQQLENITGWALNLFRKHYKNEQIQKLDIFHYVYGVLHNPAYRKKYEQNLKRDFPRIPFYEDFGFWADKGKALMDLHLHYEAIEPFKLKKTETELKKGALNKARLKADKEKGIIYLDQITRLEGVPSVAWDYKLGNRSALEWVLDQYKEKKPRDATIREKFNTYRFADYKEEVILLLQKVCAVSVQTMKIIEEMEGKAEDNKN